VRRKIFAAAFAVVASLGLVAAGVPADARPGRAMHHNVPALRSGPSTLSVNPTYDYAGGQTTPAAGKTAFAGNISIYNPPQRDANDHTLMEYSVQGGTAGNGYTDAIIEIGWAKDGVHASGDPFLFVSRWVHGVWAGSYTGSGDGWVDVTPAVHTDDPGVSLLSVVGTGKSFQWIYSSTVACGSSTGGWFAYYNGAGIGCYPLTIWSSASPSFNFNQVQFAQAFGEVYDDDTTTGPCTDMGTGVLATGAGTRANFTNLRYATGDYANMGSWGVVTNSSWYNTLGVNVVSQGGTGANAYIGGPGAC
jgi:hypothetical protein